MAGKITQEPQYFRVRKSWEDKDSQIGAFTLFVNAKNCADLNPGFSVFNEDGIKVYPTKE